MTDDTERMSPDIKLRISQNLREKIDDARGFSGRTLNAEIVARLVASFETDKALKSSVSRLTAQIDELSLSSSDVAKIIIGMKAQIIELQEDVVNLKLKIRRS